MNLDLAILSLIVVAGAIGSILLRDLIHSILSLVLTFAGLAAIYLRLGAEFIAFSQVIVYIGAVAILALFVVILTRRLERPEVSRFSRDKILPLAVCGLLFLGLASAAVSSSVSRLDNESQRATPLRALGKELMTGHVLPLEVLGVLLTAAMIGAAILAIHDDSDENQIDSDSKNTRH